jgi:hypothetical protein
MNKHMADLHRERGRLIERIASQRMILAGQLLPLRKVAATGERAASLLQGLVRYVKDRPLPVLMLAAALVLFKPKGAGRWAQRGLFVWRTWRVLRARFGQEMWRQ